MCPVFLPDNSWLRFRVCWPFPCVLVFCLFRRSPFCAPVVKPLSAGCAFLFGWEGLRGIRDINVLFAFPHLGYDVTASDVADDFINATKNKGVKTIKFNVLEDNFNEKYSGIFAWRVFVHFTKEDALMALQKTYEALDDNGLFVFNVMNREGKNVDEEWVDFSNEYHMGAERYYKYFSEEDMNEIITKTGFQVYDFHKEGGSNNNKWLVYVLKKGI